MADIGIIARDAIARGELRLIVEELGYRAVPAKDIKTALEALGTERPKLFVVAQSEAENISESLLAELEREAPFLPVITAMRERKAARAMELMRAGVFEVVAPPWSAESLGPCLSKALRFKGTQMEVVSPAEEKKGVLQYFLLAFALLVFAVGYSAYDKRSKLALKAGLDRPVTEWDLPYNHPSGLAFDGKTLWVSDWFSQSMYTHHTGDLKVLRTVHFPREIPGAMTFAGDALWVAAQPRSIIKHMLDDTLKVVGRFKDARPQSVAMTYDGLYLWTIDHQKGMMHKRILNEGLSVVESFKYPGAKGVALTFDGQALWSLDGGNKELLRHELSRPARATKRLPLPMYRGGDWKPTGLAFRDGGFWTVAESIPKGERPGRIFWHEIPKDEAKDK